MIQVLPRDAIAFQVLISDFNLSSLGQALALDFLVESFDTSRGEYTFLIEGEDSWCLHFAIDGAISNNFLHHLLLSGVTVTFTNEVGILDLGVSLALLVVRAFVSLGLTNVWSAVLGNKIAIFSKETVEERPATVTALVHIVASHEVLG